MPKNRASQADPQHDERGPMPNDRDPIPTVTLRDPVKIKVANIRTQAQRLLGNAVAAYAKARELEGAALGVA
jgi:hypothetical protein